MMTEIEIDACEHPFLRVLSPKLREILTENATRGYYGTGALLFRQDEPANRFFLIETGQVKLEACSRRGGTVSVQTLGPGDVLGWSWLFEPFTWNFQARAVTPVRVLVLDAPHLLRLTNEDHELGYELMKRVSRILICRLHATRERLLELADERRA